MAREMYVNGKQYTALKDLIAGVLSGWPNLSTVAYQKVISYVCDRCTSVLQRNKSITAYQLALRSVFSWYVVESSAMILFFFFFTTVFRVE